MSDRSAVWNSLMNSAQVADVELADELHHPTGEVDELDSLIGLNDDHFPVNRETGDFRRGHLLDRFFANRNGRTLAHAVSSIVRRTE